MIPSRKDDQGKARWSLLPLQSVAAVVGVLEYGAAKYAPHAWMGVPDARTRYFDALVRHLMAWRNGEKVDPESGHTHLAHVACNALFLVWFDWDEDQAHEIRKSIDESGDRKL